MLHLIFAIVSAGLTTGFQQGFHIGVLDFSEPVFIAWLNNTMVDRARNYVQGSSQKLLWDLISSIFYIGGTIGSLFSGLLAQNFGPKDSLIIINGITVISQLIMFISRTINTPELMILGRFVVGAACGMGSGLCPIYFSDISPVKIRGAIGTMYGLLISVALLMAEGFANEALLKKQHLWHYLFIVPLGMALVQYITLPFCAESPKHLISKSQREKAAKALAWLRESDNIEMEMAELLIEHETLNSMDPVRLIDMFQITSLQKPLIIAFILMVSQHFCGITIVSFYAAQILKSAGLSLNQATLALLGMSISNVFSMFVTLLIVDRIGRRILLLIGYLGMALGCVSLTVVLLFTYQGKIISFIGVVLLFLFTISFATSANSIPWFLITELFNQSTRTIAVPLAVATSWIANFIISCTFESVEVLTGPYVCLIFFVLNILFFIFILKLVPETKKRTIEEITNQF